MYIGPTGTKEKSQCQWFQKISVKLRQMGWWGLCSFEKICMFTCLLIYSVVFNSVAPWTVVHQAPLSMGILQARVLEWVAMPSSRGSSQPSDQIQASRTAGGFFTIWATRKPKNSELGSISLLQGIFPTQELNQGLLHCRRILYQLSHQGNGVKIQSLETHYQPSKAQPETPGFDLFVRFYMWLVGLTLNIQKVKDLNKSVS